MLLDLKKYKVKTNKRQKYIDPATHLAKVIEAGDDGVIKVNNKYLSLFTSVSGWAENILDFDYDIKNDILFVTSDSTLGIYLKEENKYNLKLLNDIKSDNINNLALDNIYKNDPIYNIKIINIKKIKKDILCLLEISGEKNIKYKIELLIK